MDRESKKPGTVWNLPVGVFAAAPTPVSATKTMRETLLGATPVAMLLQVQAVQHVSLRPPSEANGKEWTAPGSHGATGSSESNASSPYSEEPCSKQKHPLAADHICKPTKEKEKTAV